MQMGRVLVQDRACHMMQVSGVPTCSERKVPRHGLAPVSAFQKQCHERQCQTESTMRSQPRCIERGRKVSGDISPNDRHKEVLGLPPYRGESILRDLTTIVTEFNPTKIFVSHPLDYHPDHRALYLFATVALWDLRDRVQAEIYPYLVHWPKWPSPRGYHPGQSLRPPETPVQDSQWCGYALAPDAIQHKRTAVEAHRTQYGYAARYLLSFVRNNEIFGRVPSLNLSGKGGERLSLDSDGAHETQEELTEEERARFVGIEERGAVVRDGKIDFLLRLSRPLEDVTSLSLYVFGYRHDRPFGSMPKIHVKAGPLRDEVFDQDRAVAGTEIVVTRGTRDLSVVVPLAALGSPEKILTSARTYMGELPLDWLGWRILETPTKEAVPGGG